MDKVIKSKDRFITTEFYSTEPQRIQRLIETSQRYNLPIYMREGTYTTEVVMDGVCYKIQTGKREKRANVRDGVFLFGMVKGEALKFAAANKMILPTEYPVNDFTTKKAPLNKKWIATDINSAYWNIAYNLGVISERTYDHGNRYPKSYKTLRLAALSVLGQQRSYREMIGDEATGRNIIIAGNQKLIDVYKLIRFTCYEIMHELKLKLGKDFVCYRTDEIVYVSTEKNIELVEAYINEKGLYCKHKEQENKPTKELKAEVLDVDVQF